MNNPYFSIIIPAYNRAAILPSTISSVINQTFTDWELIIIDDGSKDNTREVVNDFKDPRINYFYQQNAERSAARNNGIRQANGKYICFLDSDDWYEPTHLETLDNEIKQKGFPVALFFTNSFFYQKGEKQIMEIPDLKSDPMCYLLLHPVIPARVCVHRNILSEFRFREDIVIVEDQVLWVTIANKYPVFHIPIYSVVYHLHDDNSINAKNNCYKPRLKGLRLLFKQPDMKGKISGSIKRALISNCYYGIARHFYYQKMFIKMFSAILASMIYSPFNEQNKAKLFMIYAYLFKQAKVEL